MCRNYARKNKECCYSHRNLETSEIVDKTPRPKKKLIIEGTEEKCYYNLCQIKPGVTIFTKNHERYCCYKHCF